MNKVREWFKSLSSIKKIGVVFVGVTVVPSVIIVVLSILVTSVGLATGAVDMDEIMSEKEEERNAETKEREKELKEREENAEEVKKKEKEKKPSTDDLEEWVIKTVNDEIGDESNTDKKRIDKVSLIDYVFTEDNDKDRVVNLYLNADDNFTLKMIGRGILMKSSDVFQSLFKDDRVAEVGLFWQLGAIDKYGNTSDDIIAKVILKRETFEKINYDNFLDQDYEHVADSFFMRDEFKE
ncbi:MULTISPECIES: hypothetical protein [unclassified Virgibacillus]|uniref:hypothetical protein n=1 Tax=unclassified Virgibacillus TaxID=2620237 RepID=UPI00090A84D0|nr:MULTISPECIES: hypothetical protein [unclassified Virgibacillus]API93499.1 hypothetical protein BKP57_17800 [Virgibacillus sp. 6R]MBS7430115.1 hypothetical protein [Virgibacillus sp. 19R1-5]